jgi:hypothetical protein
MPSAKSSAINTFFFVPRKSNAFQLPNTCSTPNVACQLKKTKGIR